MKRIITMLVIMVVLASIFLGSCGEKAPETPATQYGGTLRIITPLDPTVLGYPAQSAGRATFYQYCVLERLAVYAPDVWETQEYQGVLATSWEIENEFKTYTFHLREGVKFHDGTPWNAEAVKWNAQLFVDAGTSATFKLLESCEVIDEYTVRYNFKSPRSTFMVEIATGIYFISPTSYEANGGKDWAMTHHQGTGHVKIVDFMQGAYVNYERFDDYWGGKPYLDAVQYITVPDATTSEAMMENGEADMYVYAELQQAMNLDAKDGFTARYCMHHTPEGIWPSARDEDSVYYDKRVREALEYAIDRESIVKAISLGCPDVEVMYQAPIKGDPAYREGFGRKYDPAKARQLLDEAGLSAGFETTIYVSAATPRWGDVALAVQSQLAAVNIKVNIEFISPGQYMTYLLFGWPADTLLISGIPNEPISPFVAARDYQCSPPGVPKWNASTVTTPEMCTLHAEMGAATTWDEVIKAYVKLSNQAMDDAVGVYMMDWPDTAVFAKYVHSDWISYSTKVWNANTTWMETH